MTWQRKLSFPVLPPRISDDKIRFVWVTDCHIADNKTDPQYAALVAAVDYCNVWRPQAFVLTGDIGNNTSFSIHNAFSVIRACQVEVIDVIGNHDEHELAGLGQPNTAELERVNAFDQSAPFYFSTVISSGDGSWKALCIVLDCNFYDVDPSGERNVANHEPGDRIGHHSSLPNGGTYRMFGAAQLAWMEQTLAADTTSDAVLVFLHYNPALVASVTDYAQMVDKLQADGRPALGFCGHTHGNATSFTQQSTDEQYTLTLRKVPAMLESRCWCAVELSFDDAIMDAAVLHNYTDPGGWTINAPFTLAE